MFNEDIYNKMEEKFSKDSMLNFCLMISFMYDITYQNSTKEVTNEASYERDWWFDKYKELLNSKIMKEINYKELLEKYPLVTEVIIAWYTKKMFASFQEEGVPDELKEYMKLKGVTKDQLGTMLERHPRSFFDVFDDNQVYIEISLSLKKPTLFGYLVNRNKYGAYDFSNRIEAEHAAVYKSFEILNTKLEDD